MISLKRICTILIALAIFFHSATTLAQDEVKGKPWFGTLKDGTIINNEDLNKILDEHKKWLDTKEKEGIRAVLQGANLQKATLRGANLQRGYLVEANLQNADLREVNLQKAVLWKANLQKTYLLEANLQEARLWKANLQYANLFKANLQEANLDGANLQKAFLRKANLQKAILAEANLQEANLGEANLQEAYLGKANLQEAAISDADLKGCFLYGVKELPFYYYEPKAGSTPYIPSIADAPWLKNLTYYNKVHGLVDLREGFKKLGYREQERKITYTIRHTKTLKLLGKSKKDQNKKKNSEEEHIKADTSIFNLIEGFMNLILFEWTCEWGMSPSRPFIILLMLIFPFSIFYMFALIFPKTKTKDGISIGDGIWKIWIAERANKNRGSDQNELLSCSKGFEIWGYGLYFSLLSAFHVGYRDINVGGWIAKIQPGEYRLQASGWVRSVSGIQSLISVYLLALSVLTYFGRPFESY